MAVYKIFPTKDATIYSLFPNMNTGLDEIIEATETQISATNNSNPAASRFLIQFSPDEIDNVLENIIGISSSAQLLNSQSVFPWKAELQCFVATATGLALDTTLECYPVYGDWGMGTGHYLDEPTVTNGTSWIWKDYSGSVRWLTGSFPAYITGSYNTLYSPAGGGNWWTGSLYQNRLNSNTYPITQAQVFNYSSDKDIHMDITNIVRAWYTGSISWDGLIIKQSPSSEFVNNINVQPELKFFSIDTHTIYPPQLQFSWRDYSYNPGTLTVLNQLPATLTLAQNPGFFYSGSVNRFRIYARPEYPAQTWQTASVYTQNYALPSSSYYAVKDLDTNEYVINFDTQFTQLSCDSTSSYFNIHMNGLEPERYYTILVRTNINGSTIIFNDQYSFKVING
jgi:hypothetical protein